MHCVGIVSHRQSALIFYCHSLFMVVERVILPYVCQRRIQDFGKGV